MNRTDEAFEHLREANPIEARPFPPSDLTGIEMLERIPGHQVEVTSRPRPARRRAVARAAAAVLLVVLLGTVLLSNRNAEDSSGLTTVAPAPPLTDGASLEEFGGRVLPQRTYRSDALGVDFTADLDSSWLLGVYQDGALVLERTRATQLPRAFLAMARATSLADLDQARDRVPESGWALADLGGWLDRYGSGVGVTDITATTVGGLPATSFRVELPADTACGEGGDCVPFITNRQAVDLGFDVGRWYQVWWVPIDGFEPIVVVASEPDEAALAAIDSVAFGPPAPHPLRGSNPWELGFESLVPAGPVLVPALDGARFDLASEARISQDDRAITIALGDGTLDIFRPLSDLNGIPLPTSDAVLGVFREAPFTITEVEPTTVAGFPARVFELTDGPGMANRDVLAIFRRSNGEVVTWPAPTTAQLWLLEAPSGPVVIAASVSEPAELPPELAEMAELVVATLAFDDL
jgi:hypothetical protein